jgi:PEP-CTERM motif-containing protein
MKLIGLLAGVAILAMAAGGAIAGPSNVNEPSGPKILDLDGTAIPHDFTHYTVDFTTADGSSSTDLGFAFREDPAFLYLDNVSLTTGAGPNLVVNGDFESGTGSPAGWTYQNPDNATFAGFVRGGVGVGGSNAWYDGSVQAYDTIFQNIATTANTLYTVSFDLLDDGELSTFSRLSTNGDVTSPDGNGANVVVYAGVGAPVLSSGTPEPAAWAMMLLGFGGIGALVRRRKAVLA